MVFRQVVLYAVVSVLVMSAVNAGSFIFEASNDKLELGETLGEVLSAVTEGDLSELKSGEVKTKEGVTKYSQYLRFEDATTAINASSVSLMESEDDEVDTFLVVNRGTAVTDAFFEYHLQFETGLKSKIEDESLKGLIGVTLNIFGSEYVMVDATSSGSKVNLILASGAINDILKSGEKKEFTIGEKKYEINIRTIESGKKAVVFEVNGKTLKKLVKAEIHDLGDGLILGVTDVLKSQGDTDIVEFFIGGSLLHLVDDNYQDTSFTENVRINKENIKDGFVQIAASLVGDVLKISDIKYRLVSSEDLFIKKGEKLSALLKQRVGLLGGWDLLFNGVSSPAKTKLTFTPSGSNDEYTLTFTNLDDDTITFPFISNANGFKFGESDQKLFFKEGSSFTDFTIDVDDYMILSTKNDKTGKTYVVKYDSIDTATNTLHIEEIGGSEKNVQYTNGSDNVLGEASLSLGSITAKIYISNASNHSLAVDLNGDGDVASDEVGIVTKGGGFLDLNDPLSGSTHTISLTTESSKFEEASSNEVVSWTFDTTNGPAIDIQKTFTGVNTETQGIHVYALSNYGVHFDLSTPSGKSASMAINYPLSQVFAEVALETGHGSSLTTSVKDIKVSTCSNKKQDGDETGVDCGGSCPACPTCTDGKQNQDEEGIDCGGPCEKKCDADNKKSGECANGCLRPLGEGKKECIPIGARVDEMYCSAEQFLQVQKKPGMVCTKDYECAKGTCMSGACSKTLTVGKIAVNAIIGILILGIIIYGVSLLRPATPPPVNPQQPQP